jgi:translocation and assembly module TamB
MRLLSEHPLLRASLIGLGALAVFLVAVAFFLASRSGRDLVVGALLRAIESESTEVRYVSLGGDWPRSLEISDLVVSDAAGPWLEARRLSITWRPLDLLRGRLTVTSLILDAPVMHHPPKSSTAGGATGFPLGVAIEAFRLTDGQVETPAAARFVAEGALRFDAQEKSVRLAAKRTDAVNEHLELSALFREATHTLALELDAAGTGDGIVAALLAWKDAPAFVVKAKGEGPASNWRLGFDGDFNDAGSLALQGRLVWTEAMTFQFEGHAVPGTRLSQLGEALGKRITFKGKYTSRSDLETGALRVDSDAMHADFAIMRRGPGYLGRHVLSGTGSIQTERVIALASGAYQIGKSSVEATVGGTDAAPSVDLHLDLSDVGTRSSQIGSLAGKLALGLRTLPSGRALVFEGGGTASRVARLAETATWSIDGHYGLGGRDSALTRFDIDAHDLSMRASGVLRETTSHAEAKLEAGKLETLSPLLGMNLSGSGGVEATARRGVSNTPWDIAWTGNIENGVVDGTPLAPFAGQRLDIEGRAALDRDGALEIRETKLTGANIRGTIHGRAMPALALEAEIGTDLAAIGTVADFIATGPVTIRLDAQGSLDAPKLTVAAKSPQAAIEGLALGALTLTFDPASALPFPAGRLRLQSKGELGASEISAPLARDAEGGLTLDPLRGVAFGAALQGALALSKDDAFTGHIDGRFATLDPLLALFLGNDFGGEGRGTFAVSFASEPSVQASVDASGAALGDILTANMLKANYKRENHADDLSVEARDGTVVIAGGNPVDFGALSLSMVGPSTRRHVLLDGQAVGDAHGTLKLGGTVQSTDSTRRFALEALDGNLWEVPVRLAAPTRVIQRGSGLTLEPMRLSIGTGEAEIKLARTARSLDAEITLRRLPLALVGGALGFDWTHGALDGEVSLSTAAARPRGTLDLRLADFALQPSAEAPGVPLSGHFDGTWNGRVLTLNGEVTSAKAGSAKLDARLPLVSDRTGALDFASAGELSGHARWSGRIGSLWTLLLLDNHRLDGDGDLTLTASGTWRAPRLAGNLLLTNGSYDNLVTGTRLVGLDLKVDANSDEMRLAATASDGANGALSGSGNIVLSSDRGYPMDAKIELKRFRVVGLDNVTATASGTGALSGPMKDLKLKGALTLERVDATIPDRLPSSVASLPVTYVGVPEESARERQQKAERESAVALDVGIDIPARAYLRGRGLNTEWTGKLDLSGTTAVPRIKGEIGLVRGTLDFAGNVFDLSRGRVVFLGGEEIDPEIDVAATRNVRGTEVSLAVTGPVSAPRLDIRSVPALPQDQAVALLLFGKPPGSLSAFELVQVARGVAALSGRGGVGGVGLLGRAREALGLDVLSVGVGEMGATSVSSPSALTQGTTVSAGRHISKKVYVGVTQGMSAASGAIELDIQLTPHISLNSRLGEAAGGAAGVDWKWDY